MLTDLRHAMRFVLLNPGFSIAAAATLALGIGANSAMFTVVYEVLLRPLPYERPEELVKLWESYDDSRNVIAPANFADWQRRSRSFQQLAAFVPGATSLSGVGDADRIPAAHVSGTFFDTLRIVPVTGRTLSAADESAQGFVAVVRESFWRTRLGSDPAVIGRTLTLDRATYEIIGVIPDHVEQPSRATMIWRPLVIPEKQKTVRGAHYLQAIGRLREGVTVQQAHAELQSIAAELRRLHPATNARVGAGVFSLQQEQVRDTKTTLLVLFAATGVLLLLACVNVAHLLLARGSGRQMELVVRSAIGASRGRLIRQLLVEGLVIASIGAAAGLLLAMWTTVAIRSLVPDAFADARRAQVNLQVLGFTLAATVTTVAAFGVFPAVRLSRVSLGGIMRTQATHVTGRAAAGRTLIVLQVALAVILVVGAGLLLTTMGRLRGMAPAFTTSNLAVARIDLAQRSYPDGASQRRFFSQLLDRIEGVSGVEAAAVATRLPLRTQSANMTFTVDSQPQAHIDGVIVQEMSPKLLQILGLTLLRGRPLQEADSDTPASALVSRSFAMRAWGSADGVGRRFRMGPTYIDEGHPWLTVVGIVEDVRQYSVAGRSVPQVYLPYGQPTTSWAPSELVIRSNLPAPDAFAAIRAAVRSLDPNQPVAGLATMEAVLERTLERPRFTALLVSTFAALALLLALVGIYGVISYAVTRRAREIGVRVALGARRGDVLRLIGGEGLSLVGIGLAIGLAGAALVTKSLTGMLVGVEALDPATYAMAAAVMLLTAFAACVIPTLRAIRVDPASVLRTQ
ncbi:MAG TPA: ABC transporter permease [Vicinamibacterales bacterium]|nr:ABC transporter permease [Vicinamibacterales bacterium]